MSRPVQGALTVAALVLIPLLAVAGSDDLRATLDFTTGVLSLVSLTAAVAWGLIATDRLFLSTRQRLIGQGIHRAAAMASLGFLLLHATVKVSLGHVALLGSLIPFGLGVSGTSGLIGFGALAGLLMIVAAATGAMRSAFAAPGKTAGRWRALHGLAYPAWCSALIHGLYAGRQPATWVVVMYILCLLAVAAALCLRLLPRPTKRRIADLITTLISPDAIPAGPDPVIRASPLRGAEYAGWTARRRSRTRRPGGARRTGRYAAPPSVPARSQRPPHRDTRRRCTKPRRAAPSGSARPRRRRWGRGQATPPRTAPSPGRRTPRPRGQGAGPHRRPRRPRRQSGRRTTPTRSATPNTRTPAHRRRPRTTPPRSGRSKRPRTPPLHTFPGRSPDPSPPTPTPNRFRGRSTRPPPANPGTHPQETDRERPPPRCPRGPGRRPSPADDRLRPGGAARPRHAPEGARPARTDDR